MKGNLVYIAAGSTTVNIFTEYFRCKGDRSIIGDKSILKSKRTCNIARRKKKQKLRKLLPFAIDQAMPFYLIFCRNILSRSWRVLRVGLRGRINIFKTSEYVCKSLGMCWYGIEHDRTFHHMTPSSTWHGISLKVFSIITFCTHNNKKSSYIAAAALSTLRLESHFDAYSTNSHSSGDMCNTKTTWCYLIETLSPFPLKNKSNKSNKICLNVIDVFPL